MERIKKTPRVAPASEDHETLYNDETEEALAEKQFRNVDLEGCGVAGGLGFGDVGEVCAVIRSGLLWTHIGFWRILVSCVMDARGLCSIMDVEVKFLLGKWFEFWESDHNYCIPQGGMQI